MPEIIVNDPNRIVVGVGDAKFSSDTDKNIITHALGSCLGITIYDSVAKAGGLFHVMLPTSKGNQERAEKQPYVFIDSGWPLVLENMKKMGAHASRCEIKVAGGARVILGENKTDFFDIGRRNYMLLRKLLWSQGLLIKAEDVGGTIARTITLSIADGSLLIAQNGGKNKNEI